MINYQPMKNQMKSNQIKSDPAALWDRLHQPAITRVEALKQVRATIPLHPNAEREFQTKSAGCETGPPPTEN